MNKIRCAVIGVGYLGAFHAEKYAKLKQVDLIAVCDIDPKRAKSVAKKCKTTVINDYHQLLAKVDAVSIATPTTQHHEIGKFFLENGVHVLVEKPITNTVEQADELIEIANSKKCVLQVGHLERFNTVLNYVETKLDRPKFVESIRLSPFRPRGTDVNVILDLMIHDIDIIQYLIQSPIQSIEAIGAPVISNVNDIANARIKFENGCIANVTASRVSIKTERKLRIFQPTAYMSIDLHNKELNIYEEGEGEMIAGVPNVRRDHQKFDKGDAIKAEIVSFLDAIANQKPPLVSGVDGRHALATAIEITKMVREYARELALA